VKTEVGMRRRISRARVRAGWREGEEGFEEAVVCTPRKIDRLISDVWERGKKANMLTSTSSSKAEKTMGR